jgi:phytoene dehydrogenase-like protein
MKGTTPELLHHNIFFSEDYEKEFDALTSKFLFPEELTVYVNITSKSDTTDAPPGCENWFVMLNAPALLPCNVTASVSLLKDAVLRILERHDIRGTEERILHEEILTPSYFESAFNAFRGTLYGASSNTQRQAFFRPAANAAPVTGAFFCGGSCHPGGGMPLVIQSGKFAADAVRAYLR